VDAYGNVDDSHSKLIRSCPARSSAFRPCAFNMGLFCCQQLAALTRNLLSQVTKNQAAPGNRPSVEICPVEAGHAVTGCVHWGRRECEENAQNAQVEGHCQVTKVEVLPAWLVPTSPFSSHAPGLDLKGRSACAVAAVFHFERAA